MSASLEQIIPFIRPLAPLLLDVTVTDVLVNQGGRHVFVARAGRLEPVDGIAINEDYLRQALESIARMCHNEIDHSRPMLTARLADGSRVAATIPPCSPEGDTLAIRKFTKRYTLGQLVEANTLTAETADTLRRAVRENRNILVSGGTGAGKTTLLNALAQTIPPAERLIVIEDTAEIFIPIHHHVVRFEAQESRPAVPGEAAVPAFTIGDLLRHALRNQPDRIIVGEVRGGEAWDLLRGLNTGHQGSMSSLHANSALEALTQLRDYVLMSGINLPPSSIVEAIATAIHRVVHVHRDRETGQRRVTEVLAVHGFDTDLKRFQTTVLHPISTSL